MAEHGGALISSWQDASLHAHPCAWADDWLTAGRGRAGWITSAADGVSAAPATLEAPSASSSKRAARGWPRGRSSIEIDRRRVSARRTTSSPRSPKVRREKANIWCPVASGGVTYSRRKRVFGHRDQSHCTVRRPTWGQLDPVTTQTVQSPRAVSMHCARHYKCHALADSLPPRRHAPIARGKGHA